MAQMILRNSGWGALLMTGGLLLGTSVSAQTPPNGLTSKVTASPAHVKHGSAAALSVNLTDKTVNASSAVMDLEVYNARNVKVAQNTWQGQSLAKGKSHSYHWAWRPAAAGVYKIKVGVFGAGWKPLYYWNDKALVLTVS